MDAAAPDAPRNRLTVPAANAADRTREPPVRHFAEGTFASVRGSRHGSTCVYNSGGRPRGRQRQSRALWPPRASTFPPTDRDFREWSCRRSAARATRRGRMSETGAVFHTSNIVEGDRRPNWTLVHRSARAAGQRDRRGRGCHLELFANREREHLEQSGEESPAPPPSIVDLPRVPQIVGKVLVELTRDVLAVHDGVELLVEGE